MWAGRCAGRRPVIAGAPPLLGRQVRMQQQASRCSPPSRMVVTLGVASSSSSSSAVPATRVADVCCATMAAAAWVGTGGGAAPAPAGAGGRLHSNVVLSQLQRMLPPASYVGGMGGGAHSETVVGRQPLPSGQAGSQRLVRHAAAALTRVSSRQQAHGECALQGLPHEEGGGACLLHRVVAAQHLRRGAGGGAQAMRRGGRGARTNRAASGLGRSLAARGGPHAGGAA